jgi:hypothetical protein
MSSLESTATYPAASITLVLVRLLEYYMEIYFQTEVIPLDRRYSVDYSQYKIINQDRMVVYCPEESVFCESKIFLFYPGLMFNDYLIRITILNEELYKSVIQKIDFMLFTHVSAYINFLLLIRYLCLIVSAVGLAYYASFYTRIPVELVSFEHQFILVLSIGLVLFNDPFYAITLLLPNAFFAFFSTVFVTGFIAMLIFFWMIMFERMSKEPVSLGTQLVQIKNVLPVGLLFFFITVIGMSATILTRFNPGMHLYDE